MKQLLEEQILIEIYTNLAFALMVWRQENKDLSLIWVLILIKISKMLNWRNLRNWEL